MVYTQATQVLGIKVVEEAVVSPVLEEIHLVQVQKVVKVLTEAQLKSQDRQSHMAAVEVQRDLEVIVTQVVQRPQAVLLQIQTEQQIEVLVLEAVDLLVQVVMADQVSS